jgi:uncharacterized protein YjdB
MMRTMRRTMHGMVALAAAVLATGCLDDRAAGPQPDDTLPVRLGLQANILGAAAGQKVRIRTFYERVDRTSVTLESTPREVAVTPGVSQTVSVQVRVGKCLADEQRAGETDGACEIGVELTLLDEANVVIDQQTTLPGRPAAPGTSVTITEPITLADVGTVTVAPVPALRIGDTRTLTATATDASGNALSRTFTWASDNPAVLSVNATTGAVTAVNPGTAVVTATTGLKSGSGSVRVMRRVVTVSLTPDPAPSLRAAATLTFALSAKDASGADAGDLTERVITWTVANPAGPTRTATVSPNGIVTGVFPGDADVTASVDGVTKTVRVRVTGASLQVTPPTGQLIAGATLALQASVLDANGTTIPGVGVTWGSSATAIATVNSSGLVTAVSSGQATITATGGGVSGTATITVGTLSLGVTPTVSTMLAGNTLTLNVSGALGAVTWQSSNTSIATVSATGVVTGIFPGRVVVTATVPTASGTQRGTATVDVTAATLDITPREATIYEFETVQFSAVARNSRGVILTGLAVAWSSGDPQRAPINATGTVYGAAATSTAISAFAGGISAGASLRVLPYFTETFRPPTAKPPKASFTARSPATRPEE